MKNKLYIALALLFLTAACSSSTQTFSTNKKSYDPFTIYSTQPLAVPPIYYLSSQEIADERRFLRQSRENVRGMLFGSFMGGGTRGNSGDNFTFGERSFLALMSALNDNSSVPAKLDKETLNIVRKDSGFLRRVPTSKGEKLDDAFAQYIEHNYK